MAVHPMLGHKMIIEGRSLRIGHLRRECDLGVASDNGFNNAAMKTVKDGKTVTKGFPAYLIRLSTGEVVRQLKFNEQDFDKAILGEAR